MPAGSDTVRRRPTGSSGSDRPARDVRGRGRTMRLGEMSNEAAQAFGRPLDGVRVIALEQMQALPVATQLMARWGGEVMKGEEVGGGDAGRAATPTLTRENGERMGATFLRNNLGKSSVAI